MLRTVQCFSPSGKIGLNGKCECSLASVISGFTVSRFTKGSTFYVFALYPHLRIDKGYSFCGWYQDAVILACLPQTRCPRSFI
jgi:hypothetical protein